MPQKSRARLAPMDRAQTQAKFLAAFAECAVISWAANKAGVSRRTVYNWIDDDPNFKTAYDETLQEANDAIRAEIWRRGVQGWDEPQFQRGVRVGTVRKYDAALLMFLAKARMPEYRERMDVTTNGQPIGIYAAIISDPTTAELAAQLLERATTPRINPGGAGENSQPVVYDSTPCEPAE